MRAALPLIALLAVAASLPPDSAPNFFVATNGSAGNSGRLAAPIDFGTLMSSTTSPLKTNGATFWLRAGTYSNATEAFVGTGLVVRPYPGESVIIQNGIYLQAGSASNTFRGLNLVNGHPTQSLASGPGPTAGFYVLAPWNTTIGNFIAGQLDGGISTWVDGSNAVHYGDICVDSGYEQTSNNSRHGHSLYCQNKNGTKLISLCHFLNSISTETDIRGTSASFVNNVYFQSNFVANGLFAGTNPPTGFDYDFIFQRGDNTVNGLTNCWATDNVIIRDGTHGASFGMQIGETGVGNDGTNYGVHFDRNLCHSGFANLGNYSTFSFTSNTIWTDSTSWALRFSVFAPTLDYPAGAIDWNSYFYTGGNSHPWLGWTNGAVTQVSITSLGMWQGIVQGDSNGTYSASAPTTVIAKVWTNALRDSYDLWWGDVAIWNPNQISNNVPVVLTGLPAGTQIDVRHTGNILGSSVLSTTYNGTGISIPMTNLPTFKPNDPNYPQLVQSTNGASFRIFLTMSQPTPATATVGTARFY